MVEFCAESVRRNSVKNPSIQMNEATRDIRKVWVVEVRRVIEVMRVIEFTFLNVCISSCPKIPLTMETHALVVTYTC